ncbi:LUL1 [Symbiodinium natans]|uniref:LUL1 protein n=1 Tax=Symbiodinium natans TaxID=878477 RepID=A0A812IKP1_9DINO|nr:LUL1 [Symbiodinium natans]
MDPVLAVPLSFHNFWVTVLCIPVVVWAVQIGCRILVAVFLHYRLNLSRPLVLEGMSIFVDDFQQLIRQHFNQILRIRRTVPSKEISQMQVKVHVQPESLAVQFLTGDSDRVIVQFSADASQPCTVSLFWGVTGLACQDMIRRATERRGQEGQLVFADLERAASAVFPSGQYAHRSSATIPAGLGQKVRLVEDLATINRSGFDLLEYAMRGNRPENIVDTRIPLVICAGVPGRVLDDTTANVQLTFVRFRSEGRSGPLHPEVGRQLVASKDLFHQVLGIYGFEEGDRETECMVCYDRPRSVVVLPCRHCFVCPSCLRSLRDEKCPMCRSTFSAYLLLPLLQHTQAAPPPIHRNLVLN